MTENHSRDDEAAGSAEKHSHGELAELRTMQEDRKTQKLVPCEGKRCH